MRYLRPLILTIFALLCTGVFYFSLSSFGEKEEYSRPIQTIAQTGPIKEGLKTDCLAELLNLSHDQPIYLEGEEVEKIMQANPCIRKVSAATARQGVLHIDYTLRSPAFTLLDFENTALDLEGYLFPLIPYFTPKNLPKLYLGLQEAAPFPEKIADRKIFFARDLYHRFKEALLQVDVAHIDDQSLGTRELIVTLASIENITHILRISPEKYEECLANYRSLQKAICRREVVVDLRIPNLAYIAPTSK